MLDKQAYFSRGLGGIPGYPPSPPGKMSRTTIWIAQPRGSDKSQRKLAAIPGKQAVDCRAAGRELLQWTLAQRLGGGDTVPGFVHAQAAACVSSRWRVPKWEKTMSTYKHFDIEQLGDITKVRLAKPKLFDVDDYTVLRDDLNHFVEQERPEKLLVDFSRVEYCSTAVVSALMTVRDHLETDEHALKFCSMTEAVRELFRTLNLDGDVFDIHSNEAAAVAAF